MPPKSKKRKSPPSSAPALVTPKSKTNKKKKKAIKGEDLFDALLHIKRGVPKLADRWFSAAEWVSILPKYWSVLKGREKECTVQKFTRQVNKVASVHYNSTSPSGIYCNFYGRRQQWYYLFTKKESCPSPPTQASFHPAYYAGV